MPGLIGTLANSPEDGARTPRCDIALSRQRGTFIYPKTGGAGMSKRMHRGGASLHGLDDAFEAIGRLWGLGLQPSSSLPPFRATTWISNHAVRDFSYVST